MFLFFIFESIALSKEPPPFHHILVLGEDIPIDSGEGNGTHLFYYSYFYNKFNNPNLWRTIEVSTSDITLTYELNQNPGYGFFTNFEVISHGAYLLYDQKGNFLPERTVYGHAGKVGAFASYQFTPFIETKIQYQSKYIYYTDGEKKSVIPLPNSHWTHVISIDSSYTDLETKQFNTIKHGFKNKLHLSYRYKNNYYGYGYGYEYDYGNGNEEADSSSYQHVWSVFYEGGLYYNFKYDLNLGWDFNIGRQQNADRNSAPPLGSFISKYGYLPGYYYWEFQSKFFINTDLSFGFPIGFKHRLKPRVSYLYFPSQDSLAGLETYRRKGYIGTAITLTGLIAGLVPYNLSYGYGLHADRNDSKGGHELMFFIMGGFSKVEKIKKKEV